MLFVSIQKRIQTVLFLWYVSLSLLYVCYSEGSDFFKTSNLQLNLDINKERLKLIDSGMCSVAVNGSKTSLIGSCPPNGDGSNQPPTFKSVFKTRCYCDSQCPIYQDCCIDSLYNYDVSTGSDYTCRDISQNTAPVRVYLMQKCLPHFTSEAVKSLCEREVLELVKDNKYFNYLQNIPVHSTRSGIMYRNVYCAICNDDTQLTKWKTHFHCMSTKRKGSLTDFDLLQFSTGAKYDPKYNHWLMKYEKENYMCKLIVEDLTLEDMLQRYGIRLCINSVSSCAYGSDHVSSEMCKSFTSYVYEAGTQLVYKNFHCAVCNNASSENISCLRNLFRDPVVTGPHLHSGKAWLPLLFDFNFDGESDNQVGIASSCRMEDGQIWDPLLRICLNVTCGRMFKEENGECVSISGSSGNLTEVKTDCRKVVLTIEYFHVFGNGSIYVNHSGKVYKEGEYEIHDQKDDVLKSILVCEVTDKIFKFDSVQVWLSEISLSLSVICLILHLIVYSLLPKLRNRPGKILMSLSSSLICGHFFFLLESCFRDILWMCYFNSLLTYFGYISAFFWMNVMAIDIFKTFSGSRRHSNGNQRFVKYSIYAWTSAFLLVILACTIDFTLPTSSYSPKFGENMCWFNSKRGLLLFFALPLAVLLLSNILLFSCTAVIIWKMSEQAKLVNKFSEKMRFLLYVKLAIVLGLTWIFGFIAASSRIKALWYPFILLNGLQGALIFIVFTMKRKIIHMLIVKLKLRSDKYKLGKQNLGRKGFYSSLSTLTTLQTSLTSGVVPAACGSPQMLTAVRRLNTYDSSTNL